MANPKSPHLPHEIVSRILSSANIRTRVAASAASKNFRAASAVAGPVQPRLTQANTNAIQLDADQIQEVGHALAALHEYILSVKQDEADLLGDSRRYTRKVTRLRRLFKSNAYLSRRATFTLDKQKWIASIILKVGPYNVGVTYTIIHQPTYYFRFNGEIVSVVNKIAVPINERQLGGILQFWHRPDVICETKRKIRTTQHLLKMQKDWLMFRHAVICAANLGRNTANRHLNAHDFVPSMKIYVRQGDEHLLPTFQRLGTQVDFHITGRIRGFFDIEIDQNSI